jgi:hypothetical protein
MSMVEQVGTLLDSTFDWLQRPSTGPSASANFYFFNMPDMPDEAYAIYQYPGISPQRNMRVGTILEQPRLQLLGRGKQINPVMNRMNLIKDFLNTQQDVIISGIRYLDIYSLGEPGELGTDSAKRERLSCNFQVRKAPG